MDPLTLIVTALTAGATAVGQGATDGLTDAAKEAIGGLYGRLKSTLAGRLNGVVGAERTLQGLEKNPAGYDAPVRDLLTESGADSDQAILALAEELLSVVQAGQTGANAPTTTLIGTAKGNGRVYQAGRDMKVNER